MGTTYGDWLRSRREAAGMTQQELADATLMTRSHIAHIEAGRRLPSKEDARRLDLALNTGGALTNFLPTQEHMMVADRFEAALQLEQQATAIREFGLTLVPGILQTERYMRAVLATAVPPWRGDECDKLVCARLARAQLLDDPLTPMVWALLDEAVLRRPAGGREVMAEQIAHIVRLAERGRVRVQVLPFEQGIHTLTQSMLTLMWFADQPPVAYTEALSTAQLHDSPAVVERLRTRYDFAAGDALPPKESLDRLKATAKDYGYHG